MQKRNFYFEDKSKYSRVGFRSILNTSKKIPEDWGNLTYAHRSSTSMATGNMYSNFIHDLTQASPLIPVYDPAIGMAMEEQNQ
jgi:hypothetical protein